ncbi:hypothetical protein [Streptomyces sp. SID3343]|uniref:hypothetical protein n=1 Tax=Streptomyces sp. SID3343 TaxID=2690260 RepID=UPI00137079CA|nr:hypothetical protein [Streptomyces sp. SID3343]MYV97089.1 hypothetical protein [Streptomyces sp. SID3343]
MDVTAVHSKRLIVAAWCAAADVDRAGDPVVGVVEEPLGLLAGERLRLRIILALRTDPLYRVRILTVVPVDAVTPGPPGPGREAAL